MTRTIALLFAVAATAVAVQPAGAQQPLPQPVLLVPVPPPPIYTDTVGLIVADQATGRRGHFGGVLDIVALGLEVPATIVGAITMGECVPGANPCP
jgi:hypothetical protein